VSERAAPRSFVEARLLALSLCALCLLTTCSRTRGADLLGPPRLRDAGADGGSDDPPQPCARCDDGLFCNGLELCAPAGSGCLPAGAPRCDDGEECSVDGCDEAAQQCSHVRTPRDDDGDGADACDDDCDDQDAQIHPGMAELCDEVDQDCDTRTDEGTRSECGDCRPGCRLLHIPEQGETWAPTPETSDAVTTEEGGARLVLTSEMTRRFDAWIANFADGKVTKIDTRDGAQLARYDSVLLGDGNGAEPPDDECDPDILGERSGGNCPSRTAVDLNGAVYVANRAFGRQGTVTKIAGFPEDCIDRDGDGTISTSKDLDGNGQIDPFVPGEFLGQADECLLWTVDVGDSDGVPRALAVAPNGRVWVGLYGEGLLLQLDASTGDVMNSVAVPGVKPYGAAFDARGRLWITSVASGSIVGIDTVNFEIDRERTAPAPQDGCPSSYGIAVDAHGRVWLAGFSCPFAFGYDPERDDWTSIPLPDSGVTRGIAADDRGNVFVASSNDFITIDPSNTFGYVEASAPITRLTVFRGDDGSEMRIFGDDVNPLPGRGAIGVGLDSERRAWLVNQDSGSATRVDVETGEVKHFAVGDKPYTYSDFTGFALRRISAPTGFVREVREGCENGPSEWEQVTVDADLNGGRIELRARTAASLDALATARFLGPFQGDTVDLQADPGPLAEERFLELEARLVSGDGRSSPSLRELVVRLHCPL
jgi:hypothetical protein